LILAINFKFNNTNSNDVGNSFNTKNDEFDSTLNELKTNGVLKGINVNKIILLFK
jgi:hypothetical protein